MSEYNDLYYNEKFKPTQLNDLDKSWTDMWANTDLIKDSNILDIMLGRGYVKELTSVEGLTASDASVALTNQNASLQNAIQNMDQLYSTDNQKVNYQSAQIDSLNTINYALYIVYFALLVVIAFILLFNMPTYNIYIRGLIALLFIAFPFIIGYIEYILYIVLTYVYAILNGNVYTSGQW